MKTEDSKALLEVREWKAQACMEVKDLDLDAAITKRLRDAIETTRKLNIPVTRRTIRL